MVGVKLSSLIADELNGENAVNLVRELTYYWRSPGSSEYRESAEYLKGYLRRIGLEVTSIDAPMDNRTPVGNYRFTPLAWEPVDAILKVITPEERVLVSFHQAPVCINSWSASTPEEGVEAEVVYVGRGTRDEDYEGKDVRGKIVFTDTGYSWRTHYLAVEKRGAIGFINDDIAEIPHAKTREIFPDFVLWNTLYEQQLDGQPNTGWGLCISPRMGDYLRGLLQNGPVRLYARVITRMFEGVMENPMGIIEGSTYPDEEILLVSHLDHPRPAAIDNAAGCAHITEVARAINALIELGEIPRPKRTLKFFYGPEGHHLNVYFDQLEKAGRLDQVICVLSSHCGGDPLLLKGPLVLTRNSAGNPSFLDDVCTDFMDDVPRVFPSPGPRAQTPFAYKLEPRFMGGDSLQAVGWGIPAIEMARRPNIYWHTPFDTYEKTSAEEFLKCGYIFAMAALAIANAETAGAVQIMGNVQARAAARLGQVARAAREELASAASAEREGVLARRLDQLAYLVERDSQAITSTLALVKQQEAGVREAAGRECRLLIEQLEERKRQEDRGLRTFAQHLQSEKP
jgi:aminopeptidase YwaD